MKDIKEILDYMEINIEKTEKNDYVLFCPPHIHGKESDKPHLWINKETGVCHCFACGFKAKIQDFVKAFYSDITDEEVNEICGTGHSDVLSPIRFSFGELPEELEEEMQEFNFTEYWNNPDYSYLKGRGISEEILKKFEVGYNRKYNSVFIPLKALNGEFIGYKERSTRDKRFYNSKGLDLTHFLFGAFLVKEMKLEKVTIVESEIDAMYLWSCGVPAIATMGKYFPKEKANALLSLGITKVEIFTDFDDAGISLAMEIKSQLQGKVFGIWRTQRPRVDVKDANDMTKEEISQRKLKKVY